MFYDNQNNPIDPRNITKEQALNTLYVPKAISKNLTKEETRKFFPKDYKGAWEIFLCKLINSQDDSHTLTGKSVG